MLSAPSHMFAKSLKRTPNFTDLSPSLLETRACKLKNMVLSHNPAAAYDSLHFVDDAEASEKQITEHLDDLHRFNHVVLPDDVLHLQTRHKNDCNTEKGEAVQCLTGTACTSNVNQKWAQ